MTRLAVVCGLLLLAVAGCKDKRTPVGHWNVVLTELPPAEQAKETSGVYISSTLALATRVIAQGEQEDARYLSPLSVLVAFHEDGTCSLTENSRRTEGTWIQSGDQLVQNYDGKTGEPATVVWNGPDSFGLSRPGGAAFRFDRAE
jgi:hypothetical protein